jgi:hypothetical protein
MKLVDVYRVTQIGLLVCTLSVHGQQGSNNVEQRVDDILNQMTLAEKLSYIGGTGFFDIKAYPRSGASGSYKSPNLSDRRAVRGAS